MLKYVTENEYKELLGVTSIPNDFENLDIKASNYINRQTFGRIEIDNIQEEVKYVTCLIINLLDEKNKISNDIGNLKSENIEGWSVSYQDSETIELEYSKKMYDTLQNYLWNVIGNDGHPLLYCGAV